MSATVNATGTKQYRSAALTFDYTGITVAAGSNSALVLTLNFGSGSVTGITAVWDQGGANQSMTQIITKSAGNGTSVLFGLVAPTTGNKTLRVSWTGSAEIFADGIAFDGVDQTGGATSFPHSASNSATGSTITITSATGNMVVGCQSSGNPQGTATGTLLYDDHATGSVINAMAEYDSGAATVAVGSSGTNVTIVATDVQTASGATASLFRQSQLAGLGAGGPFFQNPLN